jgi:hypothetical protein
MSAQKRDQQSRKSSGQLGKKLQAQKAMTQPATLKADAKEKLRQKQVAEATADAYATQH